MAEQIAIAEIPKDERTAELLQQAAELLFVEISHKELGSSADSLSTRQASLDDVTDHRLFVGVNPDGNIVGAATLSHSRSGFELYSLAVSPDYRRRQIGAQLLQAIEASAVEEGANSLTIHPSGKESAQFYFTQDYNEAVYPDDDEYSPGSTYLTKKLS